MPSKGTLIFNLFNNHLFMINAGIVGGTGYAAGEMIRLLLNHPNVELSFVFSTSKAGEAVAAVHQDLVGNTDLIFSQDIDNDIDVLFLCMGHGNSVAFLDKHPIPNDVKIIDLSRDFRHTEAQTYGDRPFVYGLPEVQKGVIKSASNIANPGCFACTIQFALLPLVAQSAITNAVHISGITGSTGAGRSLSASNHFSWRDSNVSIYKPLAHQHIREIGQRFQTIDFGFNSPLNFIPMRGDFTRGIFITAYTKTTLALPEIKSIYQEFYADAPFVHVSDTPISLKQVVNTNNCLLHLQKEDNNVIISSITDNLLKGASGQAVQNMNLMFDLDERAGLMLKGSNF